MIKWYIECILGVEARLNLELATSPLQHDDVVVDNLFRFHINPLPSLATSGNGYESAISISSEIQQAANYFVDLIANLNHNNLILVPPVNIDDIFHSIGVSAISSLVETNLLPSDILQDLDSFTSIQFQTFPSQQLPDTPQWTSVILYDIQTWFCRTRNQDTAQPLRNDSLSLVLPQLLSKYYYLLEDHEKSHWDMFLDTLHRITASQQIERPLVFLAHDIFKLARESIHTESLLHLRDLGGEDSETATASFTSQAGHIYTRSQTGQRWEGDDSFIYALKPDDTKSKSTARQPLGSYLTTIQSLNSNRTGSSQTVITNPASHQLQGGILSERLSSSAEVNPMALSPIDLGNAPMVPEFPPEDDQSKLSRQLEEERQILTSLHLISLEAQNQHNLSSNLSVSQDFAINAPQSNEFEMGENHQRGDHIVPSPPTTQIIPSLPPTNQQAKSQETSKAHQPACPDTIIENAHRYPLLACF
ncbi:hypothetical protein BLNAU_18174 [Blattamonas nauphoetae]|uniref:Uncharacterized protein n=1 Tax=Blattamonas nauphoetae TaxID=2049346 RepID=A0ABQ9X5A9_9EUKA|nr:hypothetical protein BLNAU_18174 [Blattamonas nauphoetae]